MFPDGIVEARDAQKIRELQLAPSDTIHCACGNLVVTKHQSCLSTLKDINSPWPDSGSRLNRKVPQKR